MSNPVFTLFQVFEWISHNVQSTDNKNIHIGKGIIVAMTSTDKHKRYIGVFANNSENDLKVLFCIKLNSNEFWIERINHTKQTILVLFGILMGIYLDTTEIFLLDEAMNDGQYLRQLAFERDCKGRTGQPKNLHCYLHCYSYYTQFGFRDIKPTSNDCYIKTGAFRKIASKPFKMKLQLRPNRKHDIDIIQIMNMPCLAFFESSVKDVRSIVLRTVKNRMLDEEECDNIIYEDDVIDENNGIYGFLDLLSTSTSTLYPLAKSASLDDL